MGHSQVPGLFDRHEFGERDLAMLLRDDGAVMMQWPFDVKEMGHPIEPTSPFYAFMRGQRPPFSGYRIHRSVRTPSHISPGRHFSADRERRDAAGSELSSASAMVSSAGNGPDWYGFHLADASGCGERGCAARHQNVKTRRSLATSPMLTMSCARRYKVCWATRISCSGMVS